MTQPSESGHRYWRKLPHFRVPGGIYHVRMSVHPSFGMLVNDEDFQNIQDAIMFTHKKKYILLAFVIMPNHVHLLIQPLPMIDGLAAWCDYTQQYRLEHILGGIKSYAARRINMRHGRAGKPFWMSECFDRIARNDKDVDGIVDYIHGNPVRWGLVMRPEEYRWSSASTIYSGREEYRNWFK